MNNSNPGTNCGSKSPYGLWGAMGTRASKETIEESLNVFGAESITDPLKLIGAAAVGADVDVEAALAEARALQV